MLGRSLDALAVFRNVLESALVVVPLQALVRGRKKSSFVIIPTLVFVGFALLLAVATSWPISTQ